MDQPAFELRVQTNDSDARGYDDQQYPTITHSLPPADRGKDAWLVIAGGFVVEALVWGFAFSWGIFQEYYSTNKLFQGQESQIPIVGTVASGLMYLCSPIGLSLCRQYPGRRRQGMIVGVLVMCVAFVAASFARNVRDLILTQGVLFAVGASMVYFPVFMFIDEWFVQRKGLAYGIAWASSGLGGLILPYIISWSLKQYSFRTTLRMWAVANLILLAPALPFLKPRLPASMMVRVHRPRLAFAAQPLFIAFCLGNIIQSLGYFLPGIYLPSYAKSLGFSNEIATSSVSLLNVGGFLGCITGGFLSDRYSSNYVVYLSTAGATAAIALMWGFTSTAILLVIFSLAFGFFGGSFVAAWPGTTKLILQKDPTRTAEIPTVYAFLVAGRGIGNVVSGPLSQALLRLPRVTDHFGYGYGSVYGALIVFVAGTMFLGALGPLWETVAGLV